MKGGGFFLPYMGVACGAGDGRGLGMGEASPSPGAFVQILGALCTSISSLLFVGTADPTELPLGS